MHTMIIASHWVGLTLPGMIEEPGSFSGSRSSPSPLRGPEPSHRKSSAILVSDTASVRSAPLREHQRVVGGQGGELVRRGHERQAGHLGDLGRHPLAELGVGVETGAHRGAAGGQLAAVRRGPTSIRARSASSWAT